MRMPEESQLQLFQSLIAWMVFASNHRSFPQADFFRILFSR
jgi:hypothetical protein